MWSIAGSALFSAAWSAAAAAELFYMDHDTLTQRLVGPVGPLVISGEIVAGDYVALVSKISASEERFLEHNAILVASPGGDVPETLKIAKLIGAMNSQVSVDALTGPCVGACFLIYVAAGQRATDGEHLIGIHALPELDGFLEANQVPADLILAMSQHPPEDVHWLSDAEERSLGNRSAGFVRMLTGLCRWDDALEADVYAGRRPFADFVPLLACRTRVTQNAAHKALALARRDAAFRDAGQSRRP